MFYVYSEYLSAKYIQISIPFFRSEIDQPKCVPILTSKRPLNHTKPSQQPGYIIIFSLSRNIRVNLIIKHNKFNHKYDSTTLIATGKVKFNTLVSVKKFNNIPDGITFTKINSLVYCLIYSTFLERVKDDTFG